MRKLRFKSRNDLFTVTLLIRARARIESSLVSSHYTMFYRISLGCLPYWSPLCMGALINNLDNSKINLNEQFQWDSAGFPRNYLGSLKGQGKRVKKIVWVLTLRSLKSGKGDHLLSSKMQAISGARRPAV